MPFPEWHRMGFPPNLDNLPNLPIITSMENEPTHAIVKVDQVKQLNTRLALKAIIAAIVKDLTQIDYDGRYDNEINNLAEAISTEQIDE
jgi:hypothetical protein